MVVTVALASKEAFGGGLVATTDAMTRCGDLDDERMMSTAEAIVRAKDPFVGVNPNSATSL
jgi:hypothetical protein